MSVEAMEAFAIENGFPLDSEFTRQELREQHFTACTRNLDACSQIYSMYQSVILLFHFLMKASENVPILHIQMQMFNLNDVVGAMNLIKDYYRKWQGPEIYTKSLEYNTIQIFKPLALMDFFEVVLLAKKEAETLGRPVKQQLLKYLIVRAAQALHNK